MVLYTGTYHAGEKCANFDWLTRRWLAQLQFTFKLLKKKLDSFYFEDEDVLFTMLVKWFLNAV